MTRGYDVALSEVRLHVAEAGPDDAPLVLFVHGWGCDGRAFDRLLAQARVRAMVPDLRGHGRSGVASTRHTIPAMARDLEELLDRRASGPVVVVAHSMGGNVGVELSIRRPDLVAALVVLDPAYADPAWADAQAREADLLARGAVAVAEKAHLAAAPGADPELVELVRDMALATDPRVLIECLRSTYLDDDAFGHLADTRRRIAEVGVPLLALYPDPERAARARTLPVEQTVVEIAGVGHFLGEERPRVVWQTIADWLGLKGATHD